MTEGTRITYFYYRNGQTYTGTIIGTDIFYGGKTSHNLYCVEFDNSAMEEMWISDNDPIGIL